MANPTKYVQYALSKYWRLMAPNVLVGMAPGIIGQRMVIVVGETYMRRNDYMDSPVPALTQAIHQFISLFR